MLHTFSIPVKPHVRKYLLHHLGERYKLSQLDAFGRELRTLLQLNQTKNYWNDFTGRYKATFGVAVEGNLILQKRLRSLTSKSVIDFNNFVEAIIKTEMYGMVANASLIGMSQYAAIQAFRAKYDFQDEDISFDTLKKAWQRSPDRQRVRAKRVSVCPPLLQRLAA